MDEEEVFVYLKKQKKAVLIDYLREAFAEMTASQRNAVFGDMVPQPPKVAVDGECLRAKIEEFRRDSFDRKYYAPFNVNSKNFREIPKRTREWCSLFAGFVEETAILTSQAKHAQAVSCFAKLYELLEGLGRGKEIIFAEEVGSWLIPTNEKEWLKAYLTSLAATATPKAFTAVALPMLQHDSYQSFAAQVYQSILEVANAQQKADLQAELGREKIRTGPTA